MGGFRPANVLFVDLVTSKRVEVADVGRGLKLQSHVVYFVALGSNGDNAGFSTGVTQEPNWADVVRDIRPPGPGRQVVDVNHPP